MLVVSTLVIVTSVTWLDKPVAYAMDNLFGAFEFLGKFTGAPSFFSPLAALIFAVFIVRRLILRPFCKIDTALILADVSIIVAKFVVSPLKGVFGRTWPQYHHPSLILDGIYEFEFFHIGNDFQSFPSGHMASVCALVVVF